MNYEIHIKDTQALIDPLILHYAERGSVEVNWLGNASLEPGIVPVELNFTLEVGDGQDAKYEQYFTTDEKRFEVTKIISYTQETPEALAQGGQLIVKAFLLPESYSEPWVNPLFYVNFSAVDGLGLLKGKFLTPDFYSEEKTVIEVLVACLQLTQLDFEIFLAPAIQNHLKRNWHEIFIDTKHFDDEKKLPSAFEFLEELIISMRCQLYQCEGRWEIVGINKRHLPVVKFWKYSAAGDYLGTVEITRNIKRVKWLAVSPMVTMVPGLSRVEVEHTGPALDLPEEVYQENELVGIVGAGTDSSFFPKHWDFNNYYPKMQRPEYFLSLPIDGLAADYDVFREDLKIELKRKPFLIKGTKIRISMNFQFMGNVAGGINQLAEDGKLTDMQPYRISINSTVLYFNRNTTFTSPARLDFDGSGNAEKTLEFIVPETGYLNIELFRPIKNFTGFAGDLMVKVKKLNVEEINAPEDTRYVLELAEDSSLVKEIDLPIADDYTQNSKCFYLERTRDREYTSTNGVIIDVPVLYGRQQNGKNYSIVSLKGAKLIDEYKTQVTWNVHIFPVNNLKVHYNLNGGDEMAIETEDYYSSGVFYVTVNPFKSLQISRLEWLKWTDAVYGVEQKPYAQVVAEIEERIFAVPHLMFSGTADAPAKYNDIIEFTYKGENKYFMINDLSWNAPEKESVIKMKEGIYAGNSLGNIPPYVDAGPDIVLAFDQTQAQITQAVVSDPDGAVESLLWEKIEGPAGEIYSSATALNPLISGLTGNTYSFRLTAKDNGAAPGSDIMRINRSNKHILGVFEQSSVRRNGTLVSLQTVYKLQVSPELPVNEQINLYFNASVFVDENINVSNATLTGYIEIFKNGVAVFILNDDSNLFRVLSKNLLQGSGVVSYTAGDIIELKFFASKLKSNKTDVINENITFTRYEFVQGTFNELAPIPREVLFSFI